MKRGLAKRTVVAILLALTVVTVMSAPAMAGTVNRASGTFDLTGLAVFNPATGGFIVLDGEVDWRLQLVESKQSTEFHITGHLQGHLTGVDSVSGETYQIPLNGSLNINSPNAEGKAILIARAVAPGPDDNLFLKLQIHVVDGNINVLNLTAEIR